MERLESEHLDNDVLLMAEHRHRYNWAAKYAYGDVCDLACGYGYGGEIITTNSLVKTYVGVDVSDESITEANRRFSSPNRRYILGSALDVPLGDDSIDTVVSLETLEHIKNPEDAIREFKRILRGDGIFIGSVPSKFFDDRAEEVYGENVYHITRFTFDYLDGLLRKFFKNYRIYYSALEVVSHIGQLVDGHPLKEELLHSYRNKSDDEVRGSFHFVATDCESIDLDKFHENQVFLCAGLIDFEYLRINPLRDRINQTDQLVLLKDKYIRELESVVVNTKNELGFVNNKYYSIPRLFRWLSNIARIKNKE